MADDRNPSAFPGAVEVCNGVDDDCDGQIDGPTADGAQRWFPDDDGDGHGRRADAVVDCAPPNHSPLGDDCDDADSTILGGC